MNQRPFFERMPVARLPVCVFRFHRKAGLDDEAQRGFVVKIGYVVMPEPFPSAHRRAPEGSVALVMRVLTQRVARQCFNKLRFRERISSSVITVPPAFWQTRFYDFNVFTRKKIIEKLRYIDRNPVKRGLVESPEQWRWSSYRYYALGEVGPVKIEG
jgi:putative transposase